MSHTFVSDIAACKLGHCFSVEEMRDILQNHNKNNRPINKAQVRNLKYAIYTKQWMEDTGNFVTFDIDGNLMSGQHRMAAFIDVNQGFKVDVRYGLSPSARLYTDNSLKRTAAVLTLTAEGIPITIANKSRRTQEFSMARLIKRAQDGFAKVPSSNEELQVIIAQNTESFTKVLDFPKPFSKRASVRTACAEYLAKDPVMGKEFMNGVLGDGAGLVSGSPILYVRNYVLSNKSSTGGAAIDKEYQVIVSAIHRHRNGESMYKKSSMAKWEF
jgi:hypothetical protein